MQDEPPKEDLAAAFDDVLEHVRQLNDVANRVRTMIAHTSDGGPPAANGGRTADGGGSPREHREAASTRLTERQRQVLDLLVQGASNREISRALHITEQTVKAHLQAVYQKLGATDRTRAVVIAIRLGMDPHARSGTQPRVQ